MGWAFWHAEMRRIGWMSHSCRSLDCATSSFNTTIFDGGRLIGTSSVVSHVEVIVCQILIPTGWKFGVGLSGSESQSDSLSCSMEVVMKFLTWVAAAVQFGAAAGVGMLLSSSVGCPFLGLLMRGGAIGRGKYRESYKSGATPNCDTCQGLWKTDVHAL